MLERERGKGEQSPDDLDQLVSRKERGSESRIHKMHGHGQSVFHPCQSYCMACNWRTTE